MCLKKQVEDTCVRVAKKLIRMYPNKDTEYLIFPKKRDDNYRVSEQEARFIFVNEVSIAKIYHSVETPTRKRYSGFSSNPIVYGEKEEGGRSGAIDLSLYKPPINDPTVNIEFKIGQPKEPSITKDLLKLGNEPHKTGVFFHVLEHSNPDTVESFCKKINKSISSIKSHINANFYLFIVVLEKDKSKSRYAGCDVDFKGSIIESNLNWKYLHEL